MDVHPPKKMVLIGIDPYPNGRKYFSNMALAMLV
jgi:hypothetical protein